ncbi:unnamed protein product [Litomosoides sigmodontis]|uniref:Uncharacterized protein n=1 Tax=Litomosoides sigmodontis TaxID=42156 RepID=A0A3P7M5A0_LITSI|nr:unnamed protein product [Litomosoides sigmodontis]
MLKEELMVQGGAILRAAHVLLLYSCHQQFPSASRKHTGPRLPVVLVVVAVVVVVVVVVTAVAAAVQTSHQQQ